MEENKEEVKKKGKKWLIILSLLLLVGGCSVWMVSNKTDLWLDPDQSEGTLDGMWSSWICQN